MSKPIGGYFELELANFNNCPNINSVHLSSGRNAIEYILKGIPKCNKVWIPYFTCNTVKDCIDKIGLEFEFYSINENLEIKTLPITGENDYLIYTNYFGIKDSYVYELSKILGNHLIVDNAQALYAPHISSTSSAYSPRKFVGIPDGGFAISAFGDIQVSKQDTSHLRCSHLLKRIDLGATEGYLDFKENSKSFAQIGMSRMSNLTESLINAIDFESIKARRISNFRQLHEALRSTNKFCVPDIDSFECPMVYPYWTDDDSLKQRLISEQIFVATYWPNVLEWCSEDSFEYLLADNLINLPIDQRYNEDDMLHVLNMIRKWK